MQIDEKTLDELSTVVDFVRLGTSYFNASMVHFGHGTDNAWDEALAIVREVLHLPMDFDNPNILQAKLLRTEKRHCLSLFKARVEKQCPVPYLIHKAFFAGIEFYIDERALIPRSPIAELIEQKLSPWLDEKNNQGEVVYGLDMCCGGGCIGLATAMHLDNAFMTLVDISEDALEVCQRNVENLELEEQVNVIQSDLFKSLDKADKFDFILCNPPYVSEAEMSTLPAEFSHEPEMALTCEDEGLALSHTILKEAANYLMEDGFLILEVGNSFVFLEERYPDVPFSWLEFVSGGHGVCYISAKTLKEHFGE